MLNTLKRDPPPSVLEDGYARSIAASRKVRWDIDADVIRGRRFAASETFLPDGLSRIEAFPALTPDEKRLVSQIQGRTYANIFGLVERFINAKVLELSRDHWLGDQVALEALIRFSDEELKHQELFRRLDSLMADVMAPGYHFGVDPDDLARAVLSHGSWGVMALILHIELFTQLHYRESIHATAEISPLFKDVFRFHWLEECQHAVLDELEWRRHDAGCTPAERDQGVDDFIALVGAVDGLLVAQAEADASCFRSICGRTIEGEEGRAIEAGFRGAYRWQYILSGAAHPRFVQVLGDLTSPAQRKRIEAALASIA